MTIESKAAMVGALLALPFATLFTMLAVLRVEPPLGPLEPLVTAPPDQPNVVGTAIVLAAWLLCLVAAVVSAWPMVKGARAGAALTSKPANLIVAVASLGLVLLFVIGIIVDQYRAGSASRTATRRPVPTRSKKPTTKTAQPRTVDEYLAGGA